jgi:hypothetical protein
MPELVGQPVDGHGSRSIHEEERKKDPLPRPTERYRGSIPNNLDRAQHSKLDHPRYGYGLAAFVMGRW